MNTRESVQKDIDKMFVEQVEQKKYEEIFWGKSHYEIKIQKFKTMIENIHHWYLRRKYTIRQCCSIIPNKTTGAYLYCLLAVSNSGYSQRHSLPCPSNCGKCDEFHHDYYSDKKQVEPDTVGLIDG